MGQNFVLNFLTGQDTLTSTYRDLIRVNENLVRAVNAGDISLRKYNAQIKKQKGDLQGMANIQAKVNVALEQSKEKFAGASIAEMKAAEATSLRKTQLLQALIAEKQTSTATSNRIVSTNTMELTDMQAALAVEQRTLSLLGLQIALAKTAQAEIGAEAAMKVDIARQVQLTKAAVAEEAVAQLRLRLHMDQMKRDAQEAASAALVAEAVMKADIARQVQLVKTAVEEEAVAQMRLTLHMAEMEINAQKAAMDARRAELTTRLAGAEVRRGATMAGLLAGLEAEIAAERVDQVQLEKTAVALEKELAARTASTRGVAAHTGALHANSGALSKNHWLGVSMGNVFEKAGAGARLSGFDVGFMTMHLATLGIGAAIATSSLNLLADEASSIEQLRYGVENLGIAWNEASFDERAMTLRDATGNTVVEIREIMATLAAVSGGLIHTEDELLAKAELVLDVMRRTNASAQLSSRIVARTMAGNLESLRERFPGLTAEIDRLRDSGASLQEMGDWGIGRLEEIAGGAAGAISNADRTTAALRNSIIEIGLGISATVYPAFALLGKGLALVGDAMTILTPLLPVAAAGFVALRIAAAGAGAETLAAGLKMVGLNTLLTVATSKFMLISGAVLGAAAAVYGLGKVLNAATAAWSVSAATVERVTRRMRDNRTAVELLGYEYAELHRQLRRGEIAQLDFFRRVIELRNAEVDAQRSEAERVITLQDLYGVLVTGAGSTQEAHDRASEFVEVLDRLDVRADATAESIQRMYQAWASTPAQGPDLDRTVIPQGADSLDEFNEMLRAQRWGAEWGQVTEQIEDASDEILRFQARYANSTEEQQEEMLQELSGLYDDYWGFVSDRQALADEEILRVEMNRLRALDQAREEAEDRRNEAEDRQREYELFLWTKHHERLMAEHQRYWDAFLAAQQAAIDASVANTRLQLDKEAQISFDALMGRKELATQLFMEASGKGKHPENPDPFEGWEDSLTSGFDTVMNVSRSFGPIMDELLGMKGTMWWLEGLGQAAYAIANWATPFAALQHAAAAASFFYAASQAGKGGGGGNRGAGSGRTAQARVERRRQTLDEAPDARLRSPSGMTFAQYNDFRGAVLPGDRIGGTLTHLINRGARFRDGRTLGGNTTSGWRR